MKYIYIIHISVPMNKILLEHIHLCVFCGCFHATMHTQLSSCDKDHMPHKLKILSSLLQKTFADPCCNCLVLFTFLGPGKKKKTLHHFKSSCFTCTIWLLWAGLLSPFLRPFSLPQNHPATLRNKSYFYFPAERNLVVCPLLLSLMGPCLLLPWLSTWYRCHTVQDGALSMSCAHGKCFIFRAKLSCQDGWVQSACQNHLFPPNL